MESVESVVGILVTSLHFHPLKRPLTHLPAATTAIKRASLQTPNLLTDHAPPRPDRRLLQPLASTKMLRTGKALRFRAGIGTFRDFVTC